MTLRQITALVACDAGRSYSEVRSVIDAALEGTVEALASGDRVSLSPLGTLVKRGKRLRFRPSAGLRARVARLSGPTGRELAALDRSQGYSDVGQWDAAVNVLRALLEKRPDAADLHYRMARLYLQKGRETRASEHLELAVREGAPPGVQQSVATMWLNMGRYGKAEQIFRKLMEERSERKGALMGLAQVQHRRGLYGEAAATLQKALRLDPDDPEVHFHLGIAYHHLEHYQDALTCLETAREGSPRNPRVYWYLGLLYDHIGRADEAQAMYRKYQELRDGD